MSTEQIGKEALAATLPPEEPSAPAPNVCPPRLAVDPALAITLDPPPSGVDPALAATLAPPQLAADPALAATLDPIPQNLPSSATPLLSGSEFPTVRWERYEFVKLLGRGGMGAVYLARDRRLGRTVALKFIRGGDPNMAIRFLQEARAQARIQHPNVCKVYEVGEVERQSYIAMQYVDGKSLESASSTMTHIEKVAVIRTVAEAMHEAHKLGIIHRDIKPSNIMVEQSADGSLFPIVMDFGLARESTEGRGLTESGAVLGTPAYMAPEQARGDVRAIDRRSDVYSLGATLYELLAGAPPFCAASVVDLLLKVVHEEAPPLRTLLSSVPADLETIVMKSLNREPSQRYDSSKALADDLGRYISGEPIAGKRTSFLYRLRRRAQKHRTLVSVSVLSFIAIMGLGIHQIVQRSVARHERARVIEQARLERNLAQQLKDMEWLLRSARQLSLHDLDREKAVVRKQMAQVHGELARYGPPGQALAHYALGRGHMAMQEYPQALVELREAIQQGYQSADAHYALGFVLGKHFERAIQEARMSGGGDWAQKQLKDIEPKYLIPAIESLRRSQAMQLDAPDFLAGLISFYQRDYVTAIKHADAALGQALWLYEASKLAGDVHLERALQARDSGRYPEAETEFAAAVRRYEAAAAEGRSDAQVYEALAEAWVRQTEMAVSRGQAVDIPYAQAVAASDKISISDPQSIAGPLKKASAAMMTVALMGVGRSMTERIQACLSASQAALALQPDNPYATYTAAMCRLLAGETAREQGQDPVVLIRQAIALLESVLQKYPNFLWGLNDLAVAYSLLGHELSLHGDASTKEILQRSIKYYEMASKLDPGYINPQENSLFVYAELVSASGTEVDIEGILVKANRSFDQCVQINSRRAPCYNNYALVNVRAAQRLQLARRDPRPYLAQTLKLLSTSQTLGASPQEIEQISSLSHLLDAKDQMRRDQDPGPALTEMQSALDRCLKLAAQDVLCRTYSIWLHWAIADQLAKKGQSPVPALEQAYAIARKATQGRENSPDIWQGLAESHLRLARAQTIRTAVRDSQIVAGFAAAEKALATNPYHAQSQATQGALFLLRAQSQQDATARRASATAAAAAFNQALRSDPLLVHDYASESKQARAMAEQ